MTTTGGKEHMHIYIKGNKGTHYIVFSCMTSQLRKGTFFPSVDCKNLNERHRKIRGQ
uniref:Uncharacterized protein n=1 Tax=Arundo donax TaxID=35708 RepID=A0A0A9HK90_ARUDO